MSTLYPYALTSADPSTAIFVCWIDDRAAADGASQTLVYPGGSASAAGTQVPEGDYYVYSVHVTGLTANTLYNAEIQDAATTTLLEVAFRTLPASPTNLKIAALSDVHIDRTDGLAMSDSAQFQVVADEEPDLLVFIGDINSEAYLPTSARTALWLEWFDAYLQRAHIAKGHIIPIVSAPGNHDVGNGDWTGTEAVYPGAGYFQLFFPNWAEMNAGVNYGSVKCGNLLQLLALDTHSAQPATTGPWIGNTLDPNVYWCIPVHHSPMLPSGYRSSTDLTLQDNLRKAWAPHFGAAPNVRATLCGHIHARKRSTPMQVVTGDPGGDRFVLDNDQYLVAGIEGWQEFGDGWRHNRTPVDQWYLEHASQGAHYFVITLDTTLDTTNLTVEEKDNTGTVFGTTNYTREAEPTEPPGSLLEGGTVVAYEEDGKTYTAHIFTESGTLSKLTGATVEVEYLLAAGAGGGGSRGSGGAGGGAGGLLQGTFTLTDASYPVVIGDGGPGATTDAGLQGANGADSTALGLTAFGGGGGGSGTTATVAGLGGGSGGGGGGATNAAGVGGAGTLGQGHDGGDGHDGEGVVDDSAGGGGGGASSVGSAAALSSRGLGGGGITSSLSGTNTTYAVGGHGGDQHQSEQTPSGAANTASGGDGSGNVVNSPGGDGGSGIFIVRYETHPVSEYIFVPNETIASTGVQDQAGLTAALHAAVDEDWGTPDDDTSYIVNSGDASGHAWLGLTNTPSDMDELLTLNIRVRLRRES